MVQAGEKLKESKKKAKMASATSSSQRDWGKVRGPRAPCTPAAPHHPPRPFTLLSPLFWNGQGMACVGRTKECTIVPSNHFGPIPGIPVGTMWRFRVQVPADVGPRGSADGRWPSRRSPSSGEGYPKGRRLGIHARSFPGVARDRKSVV